MKTGTNILLPILTSVSLCLSIYGNDTKTLEKTEQECRNDSLPPSIEIASTDLISYINKGVYIQEEYPEKFTLTPETLRRLSVWEYVPLIAEGGIRATAEQYETIEKTLEETLYSLGIEGRYDPLTEVGQIYWKRRF
jgi:hypothetical protein